MSGSLSSLNTALSALRYHQVAMDVASNNIANVGTEGYSRRRADGTSVGAPAVPAVWSRYDGVGGGVRTSGITRYNDVLLDARARQEHASQSSLGLRAGALARVETGIGEPGDTGVSAALAAFRGAWDDLANDPSSEAARGQVLAASSALADSFAAQRHNLDTEQQTQRYTVQSALGEVNALATELAETNRAAAAAALDGLDGHDLADHRDVLAVRLAELTGGTATLRPDHTMEVTVGGVALVSGVQAGRLEVTGGIAADGADDGRPLAFAVTTGSGATATTTAVTVPLGGELGASSELLRTTLPAYAARLGTVAATLADDVNAAHQAGFDGAGNPGRAFFAYDPADPAGSLRVAVDASQVAASTLPGGARDGGVAASLATSGRIEALYQRHVGDLGNEVASTRRQQATQSLLTNQVDSSRAQLSGVNLDEETVSMLASQRAYEAAARVMTVVDSVLDTLINRTGMVR